MARVEYYTDPAEKLFWQKTNFVGGINQATADDLVPENNEKNVVNFDLTYAGALEKRAGFVSHTNLSKLSKLNSNTDISGYPTIQSPKSVQALSSGNTVQGIFQWHDAISNKDYIIMLYHNQVFIKLSALSETKGTIKDYEDWTYVPILAYDEETKTYSDFLKDSSYTKEYVTYAETEDQEPISIDVPLFSKSHDEAGNRLKIVGADAWYEYLETGLAKTYKVDGVAYGEKFYLATGYKLVVIANEDGTITAKQLAPTIPTAPEYNALGGNLLSDDPAKAVKSSTGAVLMVDGAIVKSVYDGRELKKGLVNKPSNIRIITTRPSDSYEVYYRFRTKKEADLEYKNVREDQGGWTKFTIDSTHDIEWEATFNEVATYDISIEITKSDNIDIEKWEVKNVGLVESYVYTGYEVTETPDFLTEAEFSLHTCRRLLVFYDQLFAYYDTLDGNILYISDIRRFSYFPAYSNIIIDTPAKDAITSINFYQNVLVALTENNIFMIKGKNITDFAIVSINRTIGCKYGWTARVVGNYLYFMSNEGLFKLKSVYQSEDRLNVEQVDYRINPLFNKNAIDYIAYTYKGNYHLVELQPYESTAIGEATVFSDKFTIKPKVLFGSLPNGQCDYIAKPIGQFIGKSIQEVRSGKNLFNKSDVTGGWIGANNNQIYDTYTDLFSYTNYIKVKPNTTYTLNFHDDSSLSGAGIMEYDSNKAWLNIGLAETQQIITFTTSENTYYIRFTVRNDSLNYVQLEQGSTATEYEAYGASPSPAYPSEITYQTLTYTTDFRQIPVSLTLPTSLKSLPDGTVDRIFKLDNSYKTESEIDTVVLNGTETDWVGLNLPNSTFKLNNFVNGNGTNDTEILPILSSHFVASAQRDVYNGVAGTIQALGGALNALYISFGTGSEINTVEKLKTWLASNNVTVVFKRATPVLTDVTDETLLQELESESVYEVVKRTVNVSFFGLDNENWAYDETQKVFSLIDGAYSADFSEVTNDDINLLCTYFTAVSYTDFWANPKNYTICVDKETKNVYLRYYEKQSLTDFVNWLKELAESGKGSLTLRFIQDYVEASKLNSEDVAKLDNLTIKSGIATRITSSKPMQFTYTNTNDVIITTEKTKDITISDAKTGLLEDIKFYGETILEQRTNSNLLNIYNLHKIGDKISENNLILNWGSNAEDERADGVITVTGTTGDTIIPICDIDNPLILEAGTYIMGGESEQYSTGALRVKFTDSTGLQHTFKSDEVFTLTETTNVTVQLDFSVSNKYLDKAEFKLQINKSTTLLPFEPNGLPVRPDCPAYYINERSKIDVEISYTGMVISNNIQSENGKIFIYDPYLDAWTSYESPYLNINNTLVLGNNIVATDRNSLKYMVYPYLSLLNQEIVCYNDGEHYYYDTEEKLIKTEDGLNYNTKVEEVYNSLGKPYHTKKFKQLMLKVIDSKEAPTKIRVTVLVDGADIVNPLRYDIGIGTDGTVYSREVINETLVPSITELVKSFVVKESLLGDYDISMHRFKFSGKGKTIKYVIEQIDDKFFGLLGYSTVYKEKKPSVKNYK